MGRRKRKNKSHLVEEDDEVDKVPRSIVVARAHVRDGLWRLRWAAPIFFFFFFLPPGVSARGVRRRDVPGGGQTDQARVMV